MKKFLTSIIVLFMTLSLSAQSNTILLEEDFNSILFPEGWQKLGDGIANWHISQSNMAGGEINELKLDWNPIFNGVARIVTPPLDFTGISSAGFSFLHFFNNFDGVHTLSVETSSDGGATWNVAWSHTYVETEITLQSSESIQLMTPDMGHSSVMISITYTGDTDKLTAWYFDEVRVFQMQSNNLCLNSIDIDDIVIAGEKELGFTVTNNGSETINNFVMSFLVGEDDIIEETFNETIAPLEVRQLSFSTPAFFQPGVNELIVNIESVNGDSDDDITDNTLAKEVNGSMGKAQNTVMIEHFSSSTCVPCVNVNANMANLCNGNQGEYTYTKYPMNYPGIGDPYYTEECGIRNVYYGYSGVPLVVLGGSYIAYQAPSQELFDSEHQKTAFTEVRGSFYTEGNVIHVKADFMAYCNTNDAKAFVTVNEKTTTGNIMTNGEAEFHHIFMKFLTDVNGNQLNINYGEYQTLEFDIDLSSTNIEEYDDLEVSAWIQNYGTKEVLNSHFLYETSLHPYPVSNLKFSDNGTGTTATATWDQPQQGEPSSYNVYLNGELVAENITETFFSMPIPRERLDIVSVRAVYPDNMESVPVTEILEITYDGVQKTEEQIISVYPNPASNDIVVCGDGIKRIEVVNVLGQCALSVAVCTANATISLKDLSNGPYILRITNNDGNTLTRIITKQ
ncbi:MAG: T9SS type A sorting domain-containing protein [Candidatus Limimorpha sp.]